MADFASSMQGLATGAHSLWGYHRDNYLYDRHMRQEQEYQVMKYRCQQTALWREDVRDLIALTQRKMDSYHVICALSLEYCITMFTEGRLEAGTPRWLLRFYLLTLGAAFSYMLIAIWFCMHASVVAQSASARLLTQFVRLYIPTWQQIEAARTYSVSFETQPLRQMLRIPFLHSMPTSSLERARPSDWEKNHHRSYHTSGADAAGFDEIPERRTGVNRRFADPWGLEYDASSNISELQPLPSAERRHVKLVRRISVHYQTYDAWARVCMTFGMIQLLYALNYFCFGYLSVQEGSPASAGIVCIIFLTLAYLLLELDWSLTRWERRVAEVLMGVAPVFAYAAVFWTTVLGPEEVDKHRLFTALVLPPAFASHALWFMWALRTLGVETTRNGAVLPLKFRAVLYLDVFGWLHGRPQRHRGGEMRNATVEQQKQIVELLQVLQTEAAVWGRDDVFHLLTKPEKSEIDACMTELRRLEDVCRNIAADDDVELAWSGRAPGNLASWRWVELHSETPSGTEVPYYYDLSAGKAATARRRVQRPREGSILSVKMTSEHIEALMELVYGYIELSEPRTKELKKEEKGGFFRGRLRQLWLQRQNETVTDPVQLPFLKGPNTPAPAPVEGHAVQLSDIDLFSPVTFYPYGKAAARDESICGGDPIVTGHDHWKPGVVPAKIFRGFTMLLAILWLLALVLSFDVALGFASFETETLPSVEERIVEKAREHASSQKSELEVVEGESVTGERVYSIVPPKPRGSGARSTAQLLDGERIDINVAERPYFAPKSIACNAAGTHFALADDMSAFTGKLAIGGVHNKHANATFAFLELHRLAPCAAMEGRALRDVAITCGESASCQLISLVARPPQLVECPLQDALHDSSLGEKATECEVAPGRLLELQPGWLDASSGELLVALADARRLGSEVRASSPQLDAVNASSTQTGAALVLSTSKGRVLVSTEVARHEMTISSILLRREIAEAAHHKASSMRFSVMPTQDGGISPSVVILFGLDRERGVVQAIRGKQGGIIGEWTLPEVRSGRMSWEGLCSSERFLFLLGRHRQSERGDGSILWRFPIPQEAINASSSRTVQQTRASSTEAAATPTRTTTSQQLQHVKV